MKVRYARLRDYKGQGDDPSFTIGKIYIALGVRFPPEGRSVMITVQRDSDSTPVLVELQYFDVIDPAVPNYWNFLDFDSGSYSIAPREFGGDFWDRFHDADPDAERTFRQVIKRIEVFHAELATPLAAR
ncbi:hypothetical protein [Herbaspirillum sp. YR522]|uniref:hypothetical protein n=1 Tax=Herbaspirillum sp. YR522 TaxID=1144342 RepID=UPI0012FAB194|nr:hypothetical protein [Herbaspirillum sp. YR522]